MQKTDSCFPAKVLLPKKIVHVSSVKFIACIGYTPIKVTAVLLCFIIHIGKVGRTLVCCLGLTLTLGYVCHGI